MPASPPLLVLSNVIVDDVCFADGSRRPDTLGGAAVYAGVAASHWWKEVGIVAGIGEDFASAGGRALAPHRLRSDGLSVRDPHTIRSQLVYFDNGERSETPTRGTDHFDRLQITPADIPASLLPAAGTYVFRDLWPAFWRALQRRRELLGHVLWEIQDQAAQPRQLAGVEAILPAIDVFSINLAEASRLLATDDPSQIVASLLGRGAKVVVLRMGSEGALVSDGSESLHLRPPKSAVVDVTGGGNAFSGGFLAGWCRFPGDLEHAARCAAAAAAVAIGQHGVPPPPQRQRLTRLFSSTVIQRLSSPGKKGQTP